MKRLMNSRIFFTMTAIVGIVASSRADETAASLNNSQPTAGSSGSDVYGWEFSTSLDIQVTSLGLYDYLNPGFVTQHPIGIWDISDPSQPLTSTIIPAGTVAPIAQGFRYVDVNPVTLLAGHDYVVAALYDSEDFGVGSLNASVWQLTMGPGLQFGGYRYGAQYPTTTLSFPTGYVPGQEEIFGPNFTYNIVPEPSMSGLCLLGSAILFISRKIMPLHSRK